MSLEDVVLLFLIILAIFNIGVFNNLGKRISDLEKAELSRRGSS